MLRSWRTAALLGVSALAIVGLDRLSARPTTTLQLLIVFAVTLVMLVWNEPLWAMRVSDRRFVDALTDIGMQLRDLEGRIGTMSHEEYTREFESIVQRLEQLNAPSADWQALQGDIAADLHWRLSIFRGEVTEPTASESRSRWEHIESRSAALIRSKTTFWLRWPWND